MEGCNSAAGRVSTDCCKLYCDADDHELLILNLMNMILTCSVVDFGECTR